MEYPSADFRPRDMDSQAFAALSEGSARVNRMETRRGLVVVALVASVFTLWGVSLWTWEAWPASVAGCLAVAGGVYETWATGKIDKATEAVQQEVRRLS